MKIIILGFFLFVSTTLKGQTPEQIENGRKLYVEGINKYWNETINIRANYVYTIGIQQNDLVIKVQNNEKTFEEFIDDQRITKDILKGTFGGFLYKTIFHKKMRFFDSEILETYKIEKIYLIWQLKDYSFPCYINAKDLYYLQNKDIDVFRKYVKVPEEERYRDSYSIEKELEQLRISFKSYWSEYIKDFQKKHSYYEFNSAMKFSNNNFIITVHFPVDEILTTEHIQAYMTEKQIKDLFYSFANSIIFTNKKEFDDLKVNRVYFELQAGYDFERLYYVTIDDLNQLGDSFTQYDFIKIIK